jgi:hypothetical protein
MSEQQAQGADAAIDLNNELKARREKLARFVSRVFRSRTISVVTIPLTNCTLTSMRKKTKSWRH